MATRLYLRDTQDHQGGTPPTAEQSTSQPNGTASSPTFARRDLKKSPGTATVTVTHTHPALTTHHDGMMRMFVSEPLLAGTITAQTWTLAINGDESNGAADTYANYVLYVWRPSTGAKVGTGIFDTHVGAQTTNGNSEVNNQGKVITFSGTSQAVNAGDVLILEVWHHWLHTMATGYTSNIQYDGPTAVTAGGSGTGSYLETPQDGIVPIDLVVQNASHNHVAENVVLGGEVTLTVQNGAHGHAAQNVQVIHGPPPGAPGLMGWWKADKLTGLVNNDLVASFTDISGNGRNLTQSTDANKPAYHTNIFNGKPAIRFTTVGPDVLLGPAFSPALAQPVTIYLVLKHQALTTARNHFDGQTFGATRLNQYFAPTASRWVMFAGGSEVGGGAPDTNVHVFTSTFNGASSSLRVDNTEIGTGDVGANTWDGIRLGGGDPANVNPLDGYVAEMLVCSGTHDTTQRDAIILYLTNEWITTSTNLTVQNASHNHSAQDATLTQVHNLTVQNASHAHSAESPAVTSGPINLIVDHSVHRHKSYPSSSTAVTIDRVRILHAGVEAAVWITKSYKVQGRANHGDAWTDLVSVTDNSTNDVTHTFTATAVRELRLLGLIPTQNFESGGDKAYRVYAFEARNGAGGPDVIAGRTVHESFQANTGESGEMLVDGQDSTKWCDNEMVVDAERSDTEAFVEIVLVDLSLTQDHNLAVANATHAHSAENVVLEIPNQNIDVRPMMIRMSSGRLFQTSTFMQVRPVPPVTVVPTLTVQNASHGHSAQSVALTQVHQLAVDNARHLHAVQNTVLTQVHNLAVQGALHGHAAQNTVLTVIHNLVVANALHAHSAENISLGLAGALTVQNARHTHSAQNVALTQLHQLATQGALHGHSVQNTLLTQAHNLAVANALHGHSAQNVALAVIHNLAVQGALHGHSAQNAVLTQLHILAVQNTRHLHLVDNVPMGPTLNVANARHLHAAQNTVLTQLHILGMQNALHLHEAQNTVLTGTSSLTVQNARHLHAAQNAILERVFNLIVQNALHGHTAQNTVLARIYNLLVQNAVQGHTASTLVLLQIHFLVMQNARHLHLAGEIELGIGALPLIRYGDGQLIQRYGDGRLLRQGGDGRVVPRGNI